LTTFITASDTDTGENEENYGDSDTDEDNQRTKGKRKRDKTHSRIDDPASEDEFQKHAEAKKGTIKLKSTTKERVDAPYTSIIERLHVANPAMRWTLNTLTRCSKMEIRTFFFTKLLVMVTDLYNPKCRSSGNVKKITNLTN